MRCDTNGTIETIYPTAQIGLADGQNIFYNEGQWNGCVIPPLHDAICRIEPIAGSGGAGATQWTLAGNLHTAGLAS